MTIAIVIASSVMITAVIGIMTWTIKTDSYEEGYKAGYSQASYDAAQIQTDIDCLRSRPPNLR